MRRIGSLLARALVLGMLPLLSGIWLGRPLSLLFGDWLQAGGPELAGLLVAGIQELARLPAVLLLGGLGRRFFPGDGGWLAVLSLVAGYGYYLALRMLLGTAQQLTEPGYLAGKILCGVALALLAYRLAWAHRKETA